MRSMNQYGKSSSSSSSSSSSPTPPLPLGDNGGHIVNGGCIHFRASNSAGDKSVFTDLVQWQQQEHTMIHHHNYMTPSLPLSQSNISSGLDLRFSWSGLDTEPWRCRRTDGKKWRCSRDVAPDQKYCDRHTHKNRPRSRKPVEPSSQQQQTFNLPQIHSNISNPIINPSTQYDQSRFIMVTQQQWQQPIHVPPILESKETDNLGDLFLCPPQHYKNKQVVGLQKFENDPYHHYHDVTTNASTLCSKTTSKHSMDGITNKGLKPASSLTLSMPNAKGIDVDNNENDYNLDIGNPWMSSSTPGGPLGEALCLRNASVTRGDSNLANDYSSITKSSCQGSHHAFSFIG